MLESIFFIFIFIIIIIIITIIIIMPRSQNTVHRVQGRGWPFPRVYYTAKLLCVAGCDASRLPADASLHTCVRAWVCVCVFLLICMYVCMHAFVYVCYDTM